jgi:pimeloyl-ACP methyl ester carboxylesterase
MTGEKYIDVDGIKTRYFEKGSGPVVVLFHGGHFGSHDAADCAEDWSLNFDGLAEWFHVFAVDKIGQGFTDNPKRDEDYTMAAVVQHAYGFLKTLGLRNVHPVGHSRGAYLVARLALEHPELFKTCILVDTNTLAPGISKNETVMANPPRPRLSRESQRWVLQRYSFGFEHITDEWLDAMMRVAVLPKYQEAVRKMEEAGLRVTRFLPHLARQKDETLGLIRERGFDRPTLLAWGITTRPRRLIKVMRYLISLRGTRTIRECIFLIARAISRTESILRNSIKCCVASSRETGDDFGSYSAEADFRSVVYSI